MSDLTNIGSELRRRVERRETLLDQIAEAQEALKVLKAEDKADGFTEKVIGQVLREKRRGAKYQSAQLSLELEVDTYRQALGLPVTLEAAQAAVRDEPASRDVRRAASALRRLADEDGVTLTIEDDGGNATTIGKGRSSRKA